MKKILFIMGLLLAIMQANAQKIINQVLETDDKVADYEISKVRQTPQSILFHQKNTYPAAKSEELLKKYFNVRGGVENFEKIMQTNLPDNISVIRYQQYFKGLKVEHGTCAVTVTNGLLASISCEYYQLKEDATIKPALTADKALAYALQLINAKKYMWEDALNQKLDFGKRPAGELVLVAAYNTTDVRLAYKFDIYATEPLSRDYVYVDALNGKIILRDPIIKHAGEAGVAETKPGNIQIVTANQAPPINAIGTATTKYSGVQTITTDQVSAFLYRLREVRNSVGVETYSCNNTSSYVQTDITNTTNTWTNTAPIANGGNGGLDAHWGTEVTVDYWKNIHTRNSYNNAGATVKSFVHYSTGYDNAYWNGSVMTYGDGSWNGSTGNFSVLTSLDVCGHEIGHAVCSSTANLTYAAESGALNEGYSDIWAACIENYANTTLATTKQPWLIGEQIEHRPGHVSLRSMNNPNVNNDPDTYFGTHWKSLSGGDYGGVHSNSGVFNKFFYILTIGEIGTNDIGNAYSVAGISFAKSQKIAYLAELNMNASTNFAGARTAFINAAVTLYGSCSAEDIATTNAWYAVGVGASHTCPCPSNVNITGIYSTALTQSQTWIKSTGQTTILSTASVKLDADPSNGYILLLPAVGTNFFLSAPTGSGVFVAQALDGCGAGVPMLQAPEPLKKIMRQEKQK